MKVLVTLVMLAAPTTMSWAQKVNEKFSLTTQIFLDEQANQSKDGQRDNSKGKTAEQQKESLIASPCMIDGVEYISCFIHLKDVSDLTAVRKLGVKVESTFDGLDFVTASVPVKQLEALADIDNVTLVKVAQQMRPTTDRARQLTNVDDLLTTPAAIAPGVTTQFDGTGVVLGIIDMGIDYNHIAFKDKSGNSRIKGIYCYTGTGEATAWDDAMDGHPSMPTLTTDTPGEDHGTHTSSTAGGSSVIIGGSGTEMTVTVTDDHANATFGGMAPGADLYLAGIYYLNDVHLINALMNMVTYAEKVDKPLVVSNSWGSGADPRDGKDEWSVLVHQYFGDEHPNRIILFAAGNNAGDGAREHGGNYVYKNEASSSNPLRTIIRYNGTGGNSYDSYIATAWSEKPLNCTIKVLDNETGDVLASNDITKKTTSFYFVQNDQRVFYNGTLNFYLDHDTSNGRNLYNLLIKANNLASLEKGKYSLAIDVYPAKDGDTEVTTKVNMWGINYYYFTNHVIQGNQSWTKTDWDTGTDDMSVSDEALIPDAISVGAYVSRDKVTDYKGVQHTYYSGTQGDIANFSSYAIAELSPTGLSYPWITAPGAQIVAAVNCKANSDVYFTEYDDDMVVYNEDYPYAAMQGTSMSTPVASGIVAQWLQAAKSVDKNLTVNDVKKIMKATAIQDVFTLYGPNASHFGNGKIDALAGIQYIFDILALGDNTYNKALIWAAADDCAANNTQTYQVILSDRTLYKDGDWNTLCLPFDVTLSESVLVGAEARTLTSANITGSTLDLTFSDPVTTLVAGTPYIIKWEKADDYDQANEETRDLKNPVFNGVTIKKGYKDVECPLDNGKSIIFGGLYVDWYYDEAEKNYLFLGAENTLYYPEAGTNIGAQRAYFEFNGFEAGDVPANGVRMLFEEDKDVTEIEELKDGRIEELKLEGWYTLTGVKLEGKPTEKGVYIYKGKKMVVK